MPSYIASTTEFTLTWSNWGLFLFVITLQWYEDSSSDITNSFPATNGPGVSSAILLSKAETWELCQGTAYGPPHFNLSGATKLEYPLPDDLGGLNDAVRSLRRA